jgi:hypothetical protein
MLSLRTFLSAGAVAVAGALVFPACGKQSEAERCELTNGNNDCDPGLVCEHHEAVSSEICCPIGSPENGTTAECRSDKGEPPKDSGVVDTAVPDTSTADTGSAETTAPVDTGAVSDADADADADAAD